MPLLLRTPLRCSRARVIRSGVLQPHQGLGSRPAMKGDHKGSFPYGSNVPYQNRLRASDSLNDDQPSVRHELPLHPPDGADALFREAYYALAGDTLYGASPYGKGGKHRGLFIRVAPATLPRQMEYVQCR